MNRTVAFLLILLCSSLLHAHAQKKPNIILIMADDMGYSDIGAYGGEIKTPNIDQLAENGIRYRQFYNAARCCPTRAALLTGLYPHQAGMGWMAAADLGTPAYQDDLNKQCVTIAEVLKTSGYSTYMTGKWHLTNERKINGLVTDSWPHQRGFDRYFGIIPGGANYFTPELYSNNRVYSAPDSFYLTNAISDSSIKYLGEHRVAQKEKPFFMYIAYTAPHWPLHALPGDIDKYREVYKRGWDSIRNERFERQKTLGIVPANAILSPRDTAIQAWENTPNQRKKEMAMRMAIYAAQIDIMDQGIGRIIALLKETGQLDNTLIFFLSDNGGCAEFISSGQSKEVDGEADSFESYRIDWANVSSTPFREYKHDTYEGGIATPLIVHWPAGINRRLNNSFSAGYGHVTDIMATCVEVAGARYPDRFGNNKIHPLEGKSLVPHFAGTSNKRGKIYWEHEANIALRDGRWKMVAKTRLGEDFDKNNLRLYDVEADPTELNDLSAKNPEVLRVLYNDWTDWAKRIGAFPLDTREYGQRIQDYRRVLNGSFNDNLGGWTIRKAPGVMGEVSIDTSNRLAGGKAALVTMEKPSATPAGLSMNWPFRAKKGESFTVRLQARSNKPCSFLLRLEKTSGDSARLIDLEVPVSTSSKRDRFASLQVPADDTYRLALYFGKLAPGDKVWIDDVELAAAKR